MRFKDLIPLNRKDLFNYSDPFAMLRRDIDSLFDRSLRETFYGNNLGILNLDVLDTGNQLTVKADVPGLVVEDLTINLDNNILTIKGEKKKEYEEDKNNYYLSERIYGVFNRAIQIPFSAKPEDVKAKIDKGVLTITIHKPDHIQQGAQQIRIEQS